MNLKGNLTSKGLQGSIGKSRMRGILGTNPVAIPITVDNALSLSSTNPVQNRVITAAITNRLWSDEVKTALLQIVEKVAYVDEHGQDYYDTLYDALYPPVGLDSIGAVFDSSATIYNTDTLDDLKQYLVVTAYYTSGDSEVVDSYTLSGSMDAGTQTITVSYGGKTTTFNVTVVELAVASISAVFTQSGTIYTNDTLDTLKQYLVVTANYSDSTTATVPSTDYTLSGTLTVGTSTITASYGGKTDTFTVTVTEYVRTLLHAWDFTQSTTDTVGSATADMGSHVTRDSSGLHFTAAKMYQYFKMFGVIESNITIEVDVASANNHDSGVNRRFICFAADTGLVYRSNGKWQWYLGAWCNPSVSVTNANVFNGKTAIIKIDSNSIPTAYDSDGNTIADNATSASSYSDLWLGSTDYTFYDMTITAVRIYRGID